MVVIEGMLPEQEEEEDRGVVMVEMLGRWYPLHRLFRILRPPLHDRGEWACRISVDGNAG
jgi:hypothetical protein